MNTREDMLLLVPKHAVCAEIGVFSGDFSKVIKSIVNPSKLYLVDLFNGMASSGDKNGENNKKISLDKSFINLTRLYSNDESVSLFKGKSADFFKSIPDHSLDFVYIDGDHSYEGVVKDLSMARTKVKKDGIISGHDYCPRFPGVMKALDEFSNRFSLIPQFTAEDKIPSFYIVNSY